MPILNQFSNALPIWRREERRLHGAFPSATAETRPTGIHLVVELRKTVGTARMIARSMLHALHGERPDNPHTQVGDWLLYEMSRSGGFG